MIIGASGLLGSAVYHRLSEQYKVVGTKFNSKSVTFDDCVILNATEFHQVDRLFKEFKPDVIVNCSGITSVDMCESKPESAMLINTCAAVNIAVAAAKYHARMIQISTDHFFSIDSQPRTERAEMIPINKYGFTKLLAERQCIQANPETLVIRTNFFGLGKLGHQSLLDFAVKSLSDLGKARGAVDVTFTPIGVHTLAAFICDQVAKESSGIVNAVGQTELTKFEFIRKVARALGVNEGLVEPIWWRDLNLDAKRPNYLSLDATKMIEVYDFVPPALDEMIDFELRNVR